MVYNPSAPTHAQATLDVAAGSNQAVSPELLAKLDNYNPAGYSPVSVAEGLQQLRREGWIARVCEPAFSVEQHPSQAAAAASFVRQLELLREVGRGSLPLGRIFEGHVNALELITRFADGEQRQQWLGDAKAGRVFGVWNTEAGDGIHLRPHAEGGYVIVGAKTFCSGARDVTRPIITGQLWANGKAIGWQMLVVDMDQVGEERIDDSFWQPLGMQASASLRVDFAGIRISEAQLLGAPNDYHVQPHFSGGAVRFAAVQLGGAQALYDHTVALLKAMHREHDPYQCHRIGRMAIALQTGNHWLHQAATQALPAWHEEAIVVHYANMCRTAILDVCNVVLDCAEQAVGARGFLSPEPIQRIYTDLKMYLRQPAPDNALAAVGHYAAWQFAGPLATSTQ